MLRPQTIQIFLPAGDPRGMRVAEITTRIVRVIEVPRSQSATFLLPKLKKITIGNSPVRPLPRNDLRQC